MPDGVVSEVTTRNFNQTSDNVLSPKRVDGETDLQSWFRCDDEVDAWEEIVGLGGYGKTLTVITAELSEDGGDGDRSDVWAQSQFRYRR